MALSADCLVTAGNRITSEAATSSLRTEWLYKMTIATREECRSELERIIGFYNTERPHMSIGMQTPLGGAKKSFSAAEAETIAESFRDLAKCLN